MIKHLSKINFVILNILYFPRFHHRKKVIKSIRTFSAATKLIIKVQKLFELASILVGKVFKIVENSFN